jgi:hypothetical protein
MSIGTVLAVHEGDRTRYIYFVRENMWWKSNYGILVSTEFALGTVIRWFYNS